MKEWNGPEGWTENQKPDEAPETRRTRIVAFAAALILFGGAVGFACMAFPYVMALWPQRRHNHNYSTVDQQAWADSWIKGDTTKAAWTRFAVGAGIAGACVTMWWLRASKEEDDEKKRRG